MSSELFVARGPSTRYLGSKQKLAGWIWSQISSLGFETVLDAMGGTGSIGYLAKWHGKRVFYNDLLRANYYIGLALIENDSTTLGRDDVAFLLSKHPNVEYDSFIQEEFAGIYYLDEENAWLDRVIGNIRQLDDIYKRAIALAALFQACLAKRPYNLFHRANLYMRTATVRRSFGNKTTWDTPFEEHFRKFVAEYNSCVFSNHKKNQAMNHDVLEIPNEKAYELVYIDPPYFSAARGGTNYRMLYHFIEGMCVYLENGASAWRQQMDVIRKTKPLKELSSPWLKRHEITEAFDSVFRKFGQSSIVVSYNTHGVPTEHELEKMLRAHKNHVRVKRTRYQYALSRTRLDELLFVAT